MATKILIEEIEIPDHEDGSKLRVRIEACDELGNRGVPGVQVHFLGNICSFEPVTAERNAYLARKAGKNEFFMESDSWTSGGPEQYVKNYLVLGATPKVRVELKTRSSKPVVKEYDLPFKLDD
jgi:hypothetical protein